jgi:hypothetical protein
MVDHGSGCEATRLECGCNEIFHLSGQHCIPCPEGYISDPGRHSCYPAPSTCTGPM